jgi:predicted transposase YbfD/YdcC
LPVSDRHRRDREDVRLQHLARRSDLRRSRGASVEDKDRPGKESWAALAAVGMVESIRDVQGRISTERRYYISSTPSMPRFMDTVRGHWSIENAEHWVLDVQFGEDRNRARKDYSAENLAAVRRMSLNMVRHNVKDKRSLKRRKTLAALDDRYRTALLFGTQGPS